jgi:hypothetical protein
MSTTISAVSIGQAAALIQAMPSRIKAAAEELGITPAMRINMVDHYSEDDLQRIAEHLRGKRN